MPYNQTELFNEKPKMVKCNCCGHVSIEYHRSYNSNMALALLLLYNQTLFKQPGSYVHMEDLILKNGYKRCGDFSYLVKYGHIQKMEGKRNDGSNRNGMYRITSAGIMFAEAKTMVKQKFIMKDGKFYGYEGKMINIYDALKDKFNYANLMNISAEAN